MIAGLASASGGRAPWSLAALGLGLLTPVALFGETLLGTRLGPRYRTRPADSTGIRAGLLAVPWALAGLVTQRQRHAAVDQALGMSLPTALAASALAVLRRVLPYLLQHWLLGPDGARPAASDSSKRAGAKARPWQLAMLAAGAAGVAGAACTAGALEGRANGRSWVAAGAAVLALGEASSLCFHAVMQALPRAFTPGEGLLLSQALVLLAAAAAQLGLGPLHHEQQPSAERPMPAFVALLLLASVAAAAILIPLLQLAQRPPRNQPQPPGRHMRQHRQCSPSGVRLAYLASAALVVLIAVAAAIRPALWLLRYALIPQRRRLLLAYWAGMLVATLPAMSCLTARRVPNILVRKGYHLLALLLFMPPLLAHEAQLLSAALAVAFALFAAAEVVRLSGIPHLAPRVHSFLTSFTDSRDSGLILVTHFTLLLGMAAPVWLSNALDQRPLLDAADQLAQQQGQQGVLLPSALAGILILGVGDAAASTVGRLAGRVPICRNSTKTLEGTAAAVVCTLAAWWVLLNTGVGAGAVQLGSGSAIGGTSCQQWARLAAATLLSCLMEAFTTQLDNLFVPCHYFAILCLL